MNQNKLSIIGELKFRKEKLLSKTKLSSKDNKELREIETKLSEMTIERKKRKNGLYDVYVADGKGKNIQYLNKNCNNYKPIVDGFYQYDFNVITYKNKIEGYKLVEAKKGGKGIEVISKVLIDNTADEIFCGIKEVISFDYEKQHFLLELELVYFLVTMNDFDKKYNLPAKYDLKKQRLICIIDRYGNYIQKPMFEKLTLNYNK